MITFQPARSSGVHALGAKNFDGSLPKATKLSRAPDTSPPDDDFRLWLLPSTDVGDKFPSQNVVERNMQPNPDTQQKSTKIICQS